MEGSGKICRWEEAGRCWRGLRGRALEVEEVEVEGEGWKVELCDIVGAGCTTPRVRRLAAKSGSEASRLMAGDGGGAVS